MSGYRDVYGIFNAKLDGIVYAIERNRYPSFGKLYADLNDQENQFKYALEHGLINEPDYINLHNRIYYIWFCWCDQNDITYNPLVS